MSVSARTRVFGLLGHPVRHSLSPAMYNALFARYGIDAVYVAFDVLPARAPAVADAIRTLDLVGVNLTVPFKERVLPHLDHLTAAAAEAGAVNVVIHIDGQLTGYNTDGEGLCRSLEAEGHPLPAAAILLGAGGTARAVASALLDRGLRHLTLLNRSPARAQAAIDALGPRFPGATLQAGPLAPAAFAAAAPEARLVVNCLAGGAEAQVEALDPAALPADAVWVDANYWMAKPPQADRCAARGLRFYTGHAMLLHQGALAFELFTGHPVTVDEIRALLERP